MFFPLKPHLYIGLSRISPSFKKPKKEAPWNQGQRQEEPAVRVIHQPGRHYQRCGEIGGWGGARIAVSCLISGLTIYGLW